MLKLANDAQAALYREYDLSHGDEILNKRGTVIRKGEYVYKLCKSEREYLEIYSFYKKHQTAGIVPSLAEADQAAWVVITVYTDRFVTLHRMVTDAPQSIDKEAVQMAIIHGLAKFKDPSFGKDMQSNLRNIGFDERTGNIIFFEDNGERFAFANVSEMIFQFLHMMREARSGKLLLGKIKSIQEIRAVIEAEQREFSDNETWTED